MTVGELALLFNTEWVPHDAARLSTSAPAVATAAASAASAAGCQERSEVRQLRAPLEIVPMRGWRRRCFSFHPGAQWSRGGRSDERGQVLQRGDLTSCGTNEGGDADCSRGGAAQNSRPMLWIPPSPNLPTPDSALVYLGTCLLEVSSRGLLRRIKRAWSMLASGQMLKERNSRGDAAVTSMSHVSAVLFVKI